MTLSVDIEHRQGAFTLRAAFTSERGLTALFGRSGSGKTTLVNAIAGLVRPRSGRIVLDGETVFDAATNVWTPPHRRHIGYVFQEPRLFPHMTVRQNLQYAQRFGRRERRPGASLDGVVDMLGVGPLMARSPAGLSGGEKQRIAIGRALLSHPRLLLMDEPLASLDEARKQEVLPYIERMRDEAGTPIVYVSHSLAEVRRLASAVIALEAGAVTAIGPPDAVLRSAQDDDADNAPATLLSGHIKGQDGGFVCVATAAGDILAPGGGRVGAPAQLRIAARDAIVNLEAPPPSSALAALAGVVARVQHMGLWALIDVAVGQTEITAQAPGEFVRQHDVAPGRPVHLTIAHATLRSVG